MGASSGRATVRAGDDAGRAIPALFESHGARVRALALKLCRNAADADDMMQEVFLRAYRRWSTFRGEADAGTWLYTIAARACRDRLRRKGGIDRRMPAVSQLMPWGETTVMAVAAAPEEHEAERHEAVARVQRAISDLPEHLRVPVIMKEVAGMSVEDTARALGLAENTIKTRLHRARLALRKAMSAKARSVDAPAPIFDRQVCVDLLKAKMDAMDRGGASAGLTVPKAELCARCSAVFRELDMVQSACEQIGTGPVPERVRTLVLRELRALEEQRAASPRRGRKPRAARAGI
ncbi:MAG: RNA polymerase sigma factor [Planctomycetota bacterium]|nr:RNA polymerase sigma factor [Planctomycetota bacterium]